ncbi:MAG: PfkB family carbohydrate kinase, partial [Deltaproteobacteria bacterium]|nr:PfkB family carbohydrate kinase [Deltaproteobacteria bacterium]
GPQGMTLFENTEVQHFPAKVREVFDVAGAGDTVVAAVALSLAAGADLKKAALIANHAAGIVVGKLGTATCSIEELRKDIMDNSL